MVQPSGHPRPVHLPLSLGALHEQAVSVVSVAACLEGGRRVRHLEGGGV